MGVMAFAIKMNALMIEWHILLPRNLWSLVLFIAQSTQMYFPRSCATVFRVPPTGGGMYHSFVLSLIQCTPAKC